MLIVTRTEYESRPIYALENCVYNAVERAFAQCLGDLTPRFMERHMHKTLRQLSCTDMADVLVNIRII